MFRVFGNAWKIADLKKKILFTIAIIVIYRIGSAIPVPYVNGDELSNMMESASGTLFGYFNMLSGYAFSQGTLPSKSADTFSAGSVTTLDLTKFSGGSKAADTFSAGTVTTIDTTKFSGGSKAADTFSAGSVTTLDLTKFSGGSKAADTFNAGSAATLATSKALTASDTGTAAGQTFTGSPVSVTVN